MFNLTPTAHDAVQLFLPSQCMHIVGLLLLEEGKHIHSQVVEKVELVQCLCE